MFIVASLMLVLAMYVVQRAHCRQSGGCPSNSRVPLAQSVLDLVYLSHGSPRIIASLPSPVIKNQVGMVVSWICS